MANHVIDQDARYLVLGSVFSDKISRMPECKGYRDVDSSIGPDNHYNAMAADVTFLCVVIVHVSTSHKSREWFGNESVIKNYVPSIADASDKTGHACSHLCA